jgi:hypothetical protein
MRTHLALLGLFVFALPLSAQKSARRVVAPCELTTAVVVPSGKLSATLGREFAIRVTNSSPRTIAMPRSPNFGWRVETLHKKDWRLKAEGGPVRRVSAADPHLVVSGNPESAPLLQIAPAHGETFLVFLPEADKALQPDQPLSTFKLSLYWAASAEVAKSNPAILPCALAPEWIVNLQKLPAPK